MSSSFESTTCAECSFPPNHSVTKLGSKDKAIDRFSIKCRDCGDMWEETLVKDSKE
jgi:uncharacterized Zn finger protein